MKVTSEKKSGKVGSGSVRCGDNGQEKGGDPPHKSDLSLEPEPGRYRSSVLNRLLRSKVSDAYAPPEPTHFNAGGSDNLPVIWFNEAKPIKLVGFKG
jgi:hypothetical protein